jgi:hypothetical protein
MALIHAVQSVADVKRVSQDKSTPSLLSQIGVSENALLSPINFDHGSVPKAGFSGVAAKNPQVIPRSDRLGIDKRQEKQLIPATIELIELN